MSVIQWIKRETRRILPVFFFFFVAFYLINMTDGLMMRREGIEPYSFAEVLLSAAVVAKVFLVIDHLPFIDLFSRGPLIYKVLWKTSLYSLTSLFIRFITRIGPYLWFNDHPTLDLFVQMFDWPKFWAIQIWFLVLFLHFVSFRELRKVMGPSKMSKIFFGRF